jgi:hypothetical protein
MTNPAETLGEALERNSFNAEHDRLPPAAGLDLTLGEILGYPYNSNKTRIPRRWKCSRWVCPMERSLTILSSLCIIFHHIGRQQGGSLNDWKLLHVLESPPDGS